MPATLDSWWAFDKMNRAFRVKAMSEGEGGEGVPAKLPAYLSKRLGALTE